MKTLQDRCREFLEEARMNAITRDGSPVDDLTAFVIAETGRTAADAALDQALPLCLYFPTEADRDEFIAAFRKAKPNAITKKLP